MATKRRKSRRRSCKHGKLKRPVRTKKGGKRRCKKSRKRKSSRKYKMRYDNLSEYDKLELIDRMSIKELLIFSKTSKENNALVKRRIRIIRNDLANNGLTQQEMDDILDNDDLYDFVIDNRINEVRVILKYFPKYINIADPLGNTSLMYASENGHTEIVRVLIDNGADVNAKTKFDGYKTALYKASEKGHTEIVRLLIEAGADPNIHKNPPLWTPLMAASANGHTEIVRMLLDAGAKVETVDEDGFSASMYARLMGHMDIVEMLKKRST